MKGLLVIEQIRRLASEGHGVKTIARALSVSKNTVRKYIRTSEANQISKHSKVAGEVFDWDLAKQERLKGRSVKNIYEMMEPKICYEHFSKKLAAMLPKQPEVTKRLHHIPGEFTQVDYCDGLFITDRASGKRTKTQFFCWVLPASSLVFGEFVESQKLHSFIRSHESMWSYFGGVTKYIVVDNLKSGVNTPHRYDPEINPVYCDYANHEGFAVLPARVRTPRDKACVEASIGVIQRGFFNRYKDHVFYSLCELNSAFRGYLEKLNNAVMPDYGVTRRDRFEIEKTHLKERVSAPYELYEWKQAVVHPDSCIQFRRSVYSVPCEYVGKEVTVKYSDKMVIILTKELAQICSHARQKPYNNSIIDEHYPEKKRQLANFSIIQVQRLAASIGPKTVEYVQSQINTDPNHPLRALRRLMGWSRMHNVKS
jgi:transposase